MSMLSDYDKRQIILLKKHINLIKDKKIDLETFVARTDSLLDAMSEVDKSWLNAIHQNWMQPEIILAFALEDLDKPLHENDINNLNNSIRQMDSLTDQYMSEIFFSLYEKDELNHL
jgi:hypothetical protein